jgi:hypothetical protein
MLHFDCLNLSVPRLDCKLFRLVATAIIDLLSSVTSFIDFRPSSFACVFRGEILMKIQIKTVPERIPPCSSSLLSLVLFIKKAYSIYLDNICANSKGARHGAIQKSGKTCFTIILVNGNLCSFNFTRKKSEPGWIVGKRAQLDDENSKTRNLIPVVTQIPLEAQNFALAATACEIKFEMNFSESCSTAGCYEHLSSQLHGHIRAWLIRQTTERHRNI